MGGAFEIKRYSMSDGWFVFDSILLVLMLTETWIMTAIFFFVLAGDGKGNILSSSSLLKLVRLVRLTRMARMARLLRAVPELIILIKGIASAARSVFFTLCLLISIVYVFAILFKQVVGELSDDPNLEI